MLKRLTHGLGAVAVVVLTSGALVYQSGPAQADEWSDALKLLTSAGGGVAAASPAVLTEAGTAAAASTVATVTACAATVICGGAMVAVGVGILAYTTKDYWVPWIQSWGQASGPDPAGVACSGLTCVNFEALPSAVAGAGFTVQMNPNPSWRDHETWQYSQTNDCVNADGSGLGHENSTGYYQQMLGSGAWVGYGWAQTPYIGSFLGCDAGRHLTAVVLDGSQHEDGPVLKWGTAVQMGPDPADSMTTTNKVCQRPDGSVYTDSRSISHATDRIPVGFCLPGDKAVSLSTVVTPPGGSPQTVQTINLAPSPAEATQYPLCASAGCEYQILIDGVPCRVGQAGCTEWYAMSQATPLRITGRYGPYQYDVTKLRWLEHAYDTPTGVNVTTTTGTANDPTTKPDPLAGVPGVAPDWFHVPQPVRPGDPMPNPAPNPTDTQGCFGSSISWNPVDWVLKPVQCALSWAFVPDAATLAGPIGDFQTAWNSRPPGSLIVGASGVFGSIGSGWNGSCGGAASASFSQPALGHPLQLPCTPTGGGVGSVPYTAMQIGLIVFTMIGLWHMVAAGISAQSTGGD